MKQKESFTFPFLVVFSLLYNFRASYKTVSFNMEPIIKIISTILCTGNFPAFRLYLSVQLYLLLHKFIK